MLQIEDTSIDVKEESQPLTGKPGKKIRKIKRKSSVTSVKDLKPISNIKSLVKNKRIFSKVI